MLIMMKVNSVMMKTILTICAFGFLGGIITGQPLMAQDRPAEPEWAAKPVQCLPMNDAFKIAYERGQMPAFGGLGKSSSVNYDSLLDVYVFLHVNLEDQTWTIFEVDDDQEGACIIGYGKTVEFNSDTLQNLTAPKSEQ